MYVIQHAQAACSKIVVLNFILHYIKNITKQIHVNFPKTCFYKYLSTNQQIRRKYGKGSFNNYMDISKKTRLVHSGEGAKFRSNLINVVVEYPIREKIKDDTSKLA